MKNTVSNENCSVNKQTGTLQFVDNRKNQTLQNSLRIISSAAMPIMRKGYMQVGIVNNRTNTTYTERSGDKSRAISEFDRTPQGELVKAAFATVQDRVSNRSKFSCAEPYALAKFTTGTNLKKLRADMAGAGVGDAYYYTKSGDKLGYADPCDNCSQWVTGGKGNHGVGNTVIPSAQDVLEKRRESAKSGGKKKKKKTKKGRTKK